MEASCSAPRSRQERRWDAPPLRDSRLLVSLPEAGTYARHHVKVVCCRRAVHVVGAFPRVSGGCTRVISTGPRCTKRNECCVSTLSRRGARPYIHARIVCHACVAHGADKTFVTPQTHFRVVGEPYSRHAHAGREKALFSGARAPLGLPAAAGDHGA